MSSDKFSRSTIEDVARQAGVSITTVSRFLNHPEKLAADTAAKIQAAVSALGFQPNAAARGLASKRTRVIGLVVGDIGGEFFNPMLRGISGAVDEAGYELLILATRHRRMPGYLVGEQNTDGLVVFSSSLPDDELRRLDAANFPVTLLHRTAPDGLSIPSVTIENKHGAREMMDYLIETRGYRRIAFLQGEQTHEDAYWREQGYREALAAHDLPVEPKLIGLGGFSETIAKETVTQWMRRGLKMDCIFAADDESAIGALFALKEAGKRVPQDVAIVGFDDIRLSRYLDPPLTTVRAPIEAAAATAVQQLIRLIETGDADSLTLLPTELVIRASCGCC